HALPPGGRATLTAALRNVNGLRATGRVDFALTGLDATADGPLTLPSLPPGGTGEARWRATAPAGPPPDPLRPLPHGLTAHTGRHGDGGGDPPGGVHRPLGPRGPDRPQPPGHTALPRFPEPVRHARPRGRPLLRRERRRHPGHLPAADRDRRPGAAPADPRP